MKFIRIENRLFNVGEITVIRGMTAGYSQIIMASGLEYEVPLSVDQIEERLDLGLLVTP